MKIQVNIRLETKTNQTYLKFHGPVILNPATAGLNSFSVSVQDLTHKGQNEMSPAEGGAGFSMTILEFKKLERNSQALLCKYLRRCCFC